MNYFSLPGVERGSEALRSRYKRFINEVCEHFNLEPNRLAKLDRRRCVVLPKHLIIYAGYHKYGITQKELAKDMGYKDHTTAGNAVRQIQNLLDTNDPESVVVKTLLNLK